MYYFQHDKAHACELANSIAAQVSVKLLRENRQALSVNKITRVLEKTFLQASAYQAAQHQVKPLVSIQAPKFHPAQIPGS